MKKNRWNWNPYPSVWRMPRHLYRSTLRLVVDCAALRSASRLAASALPRSSLARTDSLAFSLICLVAAEVCRVILFDICRKHGLAVEEEPDPGNRGRSYLEKNDYIIQKQTACTLASTF